MHLSWALPAGVALFAFAPVALVTRAVVAELRALVATTEAWARAGDDAVAVAADAKKLATRATTLRAHPALRRGADGRAAARR